MPRGMYDPLLLISRLNSLLNNTHHKPISFYRIIYHYFITTLLLYAVITLNDLIGFHKNLCNMFFNHGHVNLPCKGMKRGPRFLDWITKEILLIISSSLDIHLFISSMKHSINLHCSLLSHLHFVPVEF